MPSGILWVSLGYPLSIPWVSLGHGVHDICTGKTSAARCSSDKGNVAIGWVGSSRGLGTPGMKKRGSPQVPWKTLPRLVSRELKIPQQILTKKGQRCFFCVLCIGQEAAPLAEKGTAENTEAKLVTAGFVGGALIITINFIY